ncbi:MAG: hypothetical protein C5S44_03430 [Candidatus Methanocomedens sp.]|nr:MAG: hypothetical protein C5S44_03430 [ANME-2 cluster archaeon]
MLSVLSVVDLLCHDPFIILDQNKLKSLWNVPHNRNPNVTSQEEHLASLKMGPEFRQARRIDTGHTLAGRRWQDSACTGVSIQQRGRI